MMLPFLPEHRELEVVDRLPDPLRKRRRSDWADLNMGGLELDAFLEGPVFDANGDLLMVDIPFGRILRFDANANWSVVTEYDGWPNGMKLRCPDTLLVADNRHGLVEIERSSGQVSVLCGGYEGGTFHGLNDLTLSAQGDIYFTDQGQSGLHAPDGRVFRLTQDGDLQLLLSGVPSPNGLVLSADERTLFLAVTRANAIWRLPLAADGSVYKAGQFLQLSGGVGPDGIARWSNEDGLLVVHAGLGVWQFDAQGKPLVFWDRDGIDYPTNLARLPSKPDTFYVTESKQSLVLQVTVRRPDEFGQVQTRSHYPEQEET